jgi:nitrite reductase/ring-hydroxylating ferredoxin subunit
MSQWIHIAAAADCPPGKTLETVAGGLIVALMNVEGTYYAIEGVCPHQGGPLGKGRLEGTILTCPWHGWQFDVNTGRHCLNAKIVQPSFPVRVEAGEVFVDLGAE